MTAGRGKRFPLGLADVVSDKGAPARQGSAPRISQTASTRPASAAAVPNALVQPAVRQAASPSSAARPTPRGALAAPLQPAPAKSTATACATLRQRIDTQPAPGRAMPPALSHVPPRDAALTSERVRQRMVERVRANGVSDSRVLDALAAVPRHGFVDPGLAAQAYEESALPIGHHQTISKPTVVARMIELVAAGRTLDKVLEIGTGCGYQAAVLSHVARDVYSIERVKPLYERAKTNLRPLRAPNIRLHYGDGRLGLPAAAPFDAIVIAAAGLDVPHALREQLAIGGRLIAPVGGQSGNEQVLTLIERVSAAQWHEVQLDRVFFVPLKSGVI